MLKKNSVSSQPLNYCWAHEGAVIICFTSGTSSLLFFPYNFYMDFDRGLGNAAA